MIEKDELYPLLFDPIYVQIMWGGDKLRSHFGRKLRDMEPPVAESWELSDREGAESIVSNGPLKGKSIRQILKYYEKAVVGNKFDGGRFPLLVKLIDAGKRLSLQVHPDEEACRRIEGAEPKTEMWYLIAATPAAKIYAGFRSDCTRSRFLANINSTDIENCLQSFSSRAGDAYFINAGRPHAIGAGNLLLEIQQNSNTTYRISDWGRLGPDQKPRQLHVEKALESINFTDRTPPRISGVSGGADYNRKFPLINKCPFFRVEELRIVETWHDFTEKNSFHLLTSINCLVKVGFGEHFVELEPGRTCLLPAVFGKYHIIFSSPDKEATVIKTTLSH